MLNTPRSSHQVALLEKRERKLQRLSGSWTQKLQQYQSARLITALVFFLSLVPAALKQNARIELLFPLPFLILFFFLVWRTKKLNQHVQNLTRLWSFTTRQKRRCLGQESGRPWQHASKMAEGLPILRDLGLLGSHSLWTLMDETLTEGGLKKLLQWMCVSPLDSGLLRQRQARIQHLRPLTWFYTRLGITTNSSELNLSTLQIQDFLKHSFVQPHFSKLLVANLGLWLATVGLGVFAVVTGTPLPPYLFLAFPLLSLSSLGSTGTAFLQGVGLSHHLSALVPVFSAIERKSKTDPELRSLCAHIARTSPSKAARRLDLILGFIGTQTNPILHLFLNVLLPWTVASVFLLESLRKKMAGQFPPCVEELSEFEVYGTLLIFDKYQTSTYPVFKEETVLECTQVFHPLIERPRAVANDFAFPAGKSLGLLTGSNMSGKSTFLRTLGLNQVLANMGAPVFADRFITRPLKIETCIEVTDSLRDGYSYFYAEVRRLRGILKMAATKTPVLFLIDEIFRGTNNRERQIGSKAVIRTLALETTAIGFISTHDLELTTLENLYPSLLNLHFREDIDADDKMIFSYHLKHGPCPTTNALRIMASEGIKIDE